MNFLEPTSGFFPLSILYRGVSFLQMSNASYVAINKIKVVVPVSALCTAPVCGRSLDGTVGSNPAESIDACVLRVLCVVR